MNLRERYGEWAIVTGASSGIGEAFAHAVASRGFRPLLIARREAELSRVAAEIRQQHGIGSDILAVDLADPAFVGAVSEACANRDVGLIVSNAGVNPAGAFLDHSPETLSRILDVNCKAAMLLAREFLPKLEKRGKGGFILVGSTEGFSGTPFSAVYSATKAFTLSLGEALWGEFRDKGIDILVLMPGATDTPLLATRKLGNIAKMAPRDVAEIGLNYLAKGPSVVAGRTNQWTSGILRHLPRKWTVSLIGSAMRKILDNMAQ